ncbi:MAG: nuclear transport factor 2 family protein [Pseudomonadales bacterium]
MKNLRDNNKPLHTSPRRLRPAALLVVALLAIAVGVAGCSQTPSKPYADSYRNALVELHGTTAVSTAMTERFVRFFTHEDGAGAAAEIIDPDEMYGDPMYFSDTLVTTRNRDVALEHLRRMRSSTGALRIQVIDTQVSGQDAYLIWHMEASFEPVRRTVTSNTVGVTHLRFDEQGRIILHQDFWDSAEGFYQHVPVLGTVINVVRRSFGRDEE